MMSLGLDAGESVTVSIEGEDEEEAMKSIEAYLSNQLRIIGVTSFLKSLNILPLPNDGELIQNVMLTV